MRGSKLITVGISALLLTAALGPTAHARPRQVPPGGNGAGYGTETGSIVINAQDEVRTGGGPGGPSGRPDRGSTGNANRDSGGDRGRGSDAPSPTDGIANAAAEAACAGLWGWEVQACLSNTAQEAAAAILAQQPVGGAPPPPNPVVIAAELSENLQLPSPRIRTNPSHARSSAVVGLPTWLWIDPGSWQAMTESVTAINVTVTVEATPVEVVWRTGDGATVTCSGPGTPYVNGQHDGRAASPDCGHTYKRASTGGSNQVSATVRWKVAYDVSGAPGGGTLDDILLTDSVALRVVEVQTIN